jgi:hypothetical protein
VGGEKNRCGAASFQIIGWRLGGKILLCHRAATTCEAGAGGKISELSSKRSLMNCPGREANVERRLIRVVDKSHRTTYRHT